ncbi:hypothetical protein BpHYR1_000959 [Brachionus plicatilis]|uniref:Uncharacterized protein n=1 Tax=Brachionus plicatilis TaxID=10195 RepID=A0A3M7RDG8_BRAPC|nr:hypothetical protein BpHYR1_000959 [Brachionus plicatilis]
MNIQKIRPLKPLKVPVIVPQREHRFVDTNVPKVSKVPIETKMLTYYQEILSDQQMSDRSNISSACSVNFKKASSEDSFDSGGHVKNDIFKPFKNDKILSSFIEDGLLFNFKIQCSRNTMQILFLRNFKCYLVRLDKLTSNVVHCTYNENRQLLITVYM